MNPKDYYTEESPIVSFSNKIISIELEEIIGHIDKMILKYS